MRATACPVPPAAAAIDCGRVRSYDLALGDDSGKVMFLLRCPHENDPESTCDFAPPNKGDGGSAQVVVVPGG